RFAASLGSEIKAQSTGGAASPPRIGNAAIGCERPAKPKVELWRTTSRPAQSRLRVAKRFATSIGSEIKAQSTGGVGPPPRIGNAAIGCKRQVKPKVELWRTTSRPAQYRLRVAKRFATSIGSEIKAQSTGGVGPPPRIGNAAIGCERPAKPKVELWRT